MADDARAGEGAGEVGTQGAITGLREPTANHCLLKTLAQVRNGTGP